VLTAEILVAAAGGLALIYTGLAEVAATEPHWAVTEWALETAMESGVRRRARGIAAPVFLADEARVRAGAPAYEDMCAGCHGAPGREPGPGAKGMLPEPPDLARVHREWSPAELFWITRNGVRMTGMPAFGPTHRDDEIWELVAFVERLDALSPDAYRELSGARPGPGQGDEHEHEQGREPEHEEESGE
jgi:mono/diheme cytochrome c family protein